MAEAEQQFGRKMTENRHPSYRPVSPLWWGIDPDGHPNEAKLAAIVEIDD